MGKSSREKRERSLVQDRSQRTILTKAPLLEKALLLFIEFGIYISLFSPLVLNKLFFFPFVSPKTIFFRIIVDIILILYVILVLLNRRYLPKFNILTFAIVLYLAVMILASFFGVNLEKSFWSVFERMTGLLTFFHLFAFFIILTGCFREKKYWERFLTVAVLVGLFLSLYILFSDQASSRGGGTVGNVSFMAGYLLFDIFFAIILFFSRKRDVWGIILKIFYGVSLLFMLYTIFFSEELPRGAIGAFVGGVVLLAVGYLAFSPKKLFKIMAPASLALMLLILLLVSQTAFFKTKITALNDLPGESRRIVWEVGFKSWQERPWLGWGPENFNIAFANNFDPRLFATVDIWYDRVHNIVLDVLNEAGIIGLISYLGIFAAAIFSLLKVSAGIKERRDIFLPLGMAVILLIYFFQNLWVFDMISTYLMFFLSLAFISFLMSKKEETPPVPEATYPSLKTTGFLFPFFGAFLIIIILLTLYFGNIHPARASVNIIKGMVSPLNESISYFESVFRMTPMAKFEAPEQFSRRMTDLIYTQGLDRATLEKGLALSVQRLEETISQSPMDFRNTLLLGRHYLSVYTLDSKQETLDLAEEFLTKSRELSPKNLQVHWSLAQVRLFQGRTQEAIDFLQQAVDLEPRTNKARWFLAMGYKSAGNNEMALKELKEAEKLGYAWTDNMEDTIKAIEIYQDLAKYEEAASIYKMVLQKDPANAKFWAGLAVASANLGKFDEARAFATEAMRLNPDFAPQLQEFLNSLPKDQKP